MENIVTYINYFTALLFDVDLLVTPSALIEALSETPSDLYAIPGFLLSQPSTLFSMAVWTFFGVLIVRLLLIAPYRFVKSLVRRIKP